MRQCLAVSLLLLLPGCGLQFNMTRELWQPDPHVVPIDDKSAQLAVDGISVCSEGDAAESEPGTRVLLHTHRVRGRVTRALGDVLAGPCCFALAWPEEPLTARAMAELFAAQPIGAIDRCAVEASWTLTAQGERNWEGYVEVRGRLSPELCRSELDQAAAMDLLACAAAVVRPEPAALARCIEAAERVDWRILLPNAADGKGEVIGCLARGAHAGPEATAEASAVDLLVRAGGTAPFRYLRVPAAAMPVLALAYRDPLTLFDRFVLQTRCQTRFASAACPDVGVFAPPKVMTFAFASNGEEARRYRHPFWNALVTPFAVLGDVGKWLWQHGPMQLIFPLPVEEPPPRRNR